MEDAQLQAKQVKAKGYAQEPERFTLRQMVIELQGDTTTRLITWLYRSWRCSGVGRGL